jgi:hypothetical protein
MVVIQIVCLADGRATPHDGEYLVDDTIEGLVAHLVTTPHVAKARGFSSSTEALEHWRRQSVVYPLRPDGKPNRPLTAYTVEVTHVP